MPAGLRRVDVDEHALGPARRDDLGNRLEGADLVVGPLHVHEDRRVVDRSDQIIGIDPSGPVHAHHRVAPACRPLAHRRVLDCGEHDVIVDAAIIFATCVGSFGCVGGGTSACTPRRGGDRFGRSGGEHDLAAAGAERVGNVFPGVFDRDPGGHAFLVDAPRITGERTIRPGVDGCAHGIGRSGSERRARRVVKVRAVHVSRRRT